DLRLHCVQPHFLDRYRDRDHHHKHHQFSSDSAHDSPSKAFRLSVRASCGEDRIFCETGESLLALSVSLTRLAVGLEPPSALDAATSFAPIRRSGCWFPRWPVTRRHIQH